MAEFERARKLISHEEALRFCLRVAANNGGLLAQHADERSLVHAGINPLAHSLRYTVSMALETAAQHLDAYIKVTRPNGAERTESLQAISRKLSELGNSAATQTLPAAELKHVWTQLTGLGFDLGSDRVINATSSDSEP